MIGNRGRNEPLRIFFPTLSPLGVDDIGVVKIREGDGRVLEENRVIELESKACARGKDGRERNLWEMREKCSSRVSSDGTD